MSIFTTLKYKTIDYLDKCVCFWVSAGFNPLMSMSTFCITCVYSMHVYLNLTFFGKTKFPNSQFFFFRSFQHLALYTKSQLLRRLQDFRFVFSFLLSSLVTKMDCNDFLANIASIYVRLSFSLVTLIPHHLQGQHWMAEVSPGNG